MGKHPTHHGGKGAAKGAVCSPSRGKTCGLELAKVKRMGFNVFAFRQRSEDGDSERVRYVYASEKETIRCRRELLQRSREERSAIDLSAVIDDDSVFGAELVNDVEVANAIASDDATSETTDTASIEPPAEDYVMLVPPMRTEDDCEFISSLPEPNDITSGCDVLCKDTTLHFEQEGEEQEGEEHFFDRLRDWVWEQSVTQCV